MVVRTLIQKWCLGLAVAAAAAADDDDDDDDIVVRHDDDDGDMCFHILPV